MSFRDKINLFFIDPEMMPMFVQENYLSCFGQSTKYEDLTRLAQSSDFISLGDSINNQIRSHQDWSLLPNLGIMSSIAIGVLNQGYVPYCKFPEWFGKNSTTRKSQRLVREIRERCGHHLYTVKNAIQFEHVSLIYELIMQYLNTGGQNQIQTAVEILVDLGMNVEFFKENIVQIVPDPQRADMFNQLAAQIKTQFTKAFNQAYKSSIKGTKKGKAKDTSGIPSGANNVLNTNFDAADDVGGTYTDEDSQNGSQDDVEIEVIEDKKGKQKSQKEKEKQKQSKNTKDSSQVLGTRSRGRGRGAAAQQSKENESVGFATASNKEIKKRGRAKK
ncbi:replication factor c subunit 1 [Stylonychia lemnae]|uniref:Replication factor c subunit 1 n=1 Tax=Stylonychia lemnae TaxID=5949 RepID=A0A078APK5_STYLE|nr:replication factor c subunit 1 [Stylonychia lemnae]|eukprot:CDW82868.1 replication factor c subunit 1 [Stylonychia lemnae]